LAAKIFEYYGSKRTLWLYDTFSGMTEPGSVDVSDFEGSAKKSYNYLLRKNIAWCFSSLSEVKSNLVHFGINLDYCIFVVGDVLKTLSVPKNIPAKIAVLRLDTDWYDSTKIELEKLYDFVSNRGILMFDDYGYWGGHRKAVDEYFNDLNLKPLLMYIDLPGRVMHKIGQ
jgi:hypothetical protein